MLIAIFISILPIGEEKSLTARRINTPLKIDGIIDEAVWKTAPVADSFVSLRPTPFQKRKT